MPGILTPTRTPPSVKNAPKSGNNGFDFEECEHIVFPDNPDLALCGVDQTDVPWEQGFPVCQACVSVARGGMN